MGKLSVSALSKKIGSKINRAFFSPRPEVLKRLKTPPFKIRYLGTKYGGWAICETQTLPSSAAISCGAGEDISFDLELLKNYDCEIAILDPTPRAISHFAELKAKAEHGERMAINHSDTEFYNLSGLNLGRISWISKAVWSKETKLKFFAPQDSTHVSHSLTNLQNTESFIEVDTIRLASVFDQFGNKNVSILKMDIEGAEIEVLTDFLDGDFFPEQILVEFEELVFLKRNSKKRIVAVLEKLELAGYSLVHFDGTSNCSFLRWK